MLWPSTTIKPHARPWICSKSSTSTPTTTNMAVIASLSRKTGSGLRTTNQGQTLPDHSDGNPTTGISAWWKPSPRSTRSEEHTSELQSLAYLVCRLLLEKKKHKTYRLSSGTLRQLHSLLLNNIGRTINIHNGLATFRA